MLGFLFSLGFYDDSDVCSKHFQSSFSYALDLRIIGPWARIRQAQFKEGPSCHIFYPFKAYPMGTQELGIGTAPKAPRDPVLGLLGSNPSGPPQLYPAFKSNVQHNLVIVVDIINKSPVSFIT